MESTAANDLAIEFCDVSYTLPTGQQVLSGLNLEVRRGKTMLEFPPVDSGCGYYARSDSDTLPGSNHLLGIYTHAVEEDDRLVAEQLGEMLCPNVANLAQEKTFAESEGVVIQ
jgi:hypothetical protein